MRGLRGKWEVFYSDRDNRQRVLLLFSFFVNRICFVGVVRIMLE